MRLAPLYQEDRARAIQEGIEQGRQEGIREGRQEGITEGRQEGESSLIIRQLNRRIGGISSGLEDRIRQLPLNTLEVLGEALLDFETEADLLNWLENC